MTSDEWRELYKSTLDRTVVHGIIPEGVTSIPAYFYQSATRLQDVQFPTNTAVTSIGNYAFNGCTALRSISLPSTLTSIGQDAFNGCTALQAPIDIPSGITNLPARCFQNVKTTGITLHDGLVSIQTQVFMGCSNVRELVIPDTVTSIQSEAFRTMNGMTELVIGTGVSQLVGYLLREKNGTWNLTMTRTASVVLCGDWQGEPWKGGTAPAHIYVPSSMVDAYKNSTGSYNWSSYANRISAIEDRVTT